MSAPLSSSHFSVQRNNQRGLPHHYVLSPSVESGGHLVSPELIGDLRENVVPAFMLLAGVTDLTQTGFRMVVDITPPVKPTIHLVAGVGVPNLSPQDWRTPQTTSWNPQDEAPFFDSCAEAAGESLEQMKFGLGMLYAGDERDVFGVYDGDPKAKTHFLMLAAQRFGTMVDEEFTAKHWVKFFQNTYKILESLGLTNQPTRYIVNSGAGYQLAPRLHMHVQNSKGSMPRIFPHDYDFEIFPDGTILAPVGSSKHAAVIALIDQRQTIEGFSNEAIAQRKEIDQKILDALK